jgi:hypothetical protein
MNVKPRRPITIPFLSVGSGGGAFLSAWDDWL